MLSMVRTVACALGLCLPAIASAQQPAPAAVAADRGPFSKGVLGVEFAGTVAAEAWNLNGTHEWILDGSFSFWWARKDGKAILVEFHAMPVVQDRSRNAFVNAITPIFRCRIAERGRSTIFMEFGAGLSWSDTRVPPRGTRYNYLTATGLGFTRRLSSQVHAVGTFRWLHLSNAGWEGADHNPDIEALGGYWGIAIGFR